MEACRYCGRPFDKIPIKPPMAVVKVRRGAELCDDCEAVMLYSTIHKLLHLTPKYKLFGGTSR